ncbi:golgi uridine diphosphate-N- acetylglucosamine transporter [Ceratobasidium sp. 394]|nr:golgi uridine diphosphate-N- acetylglucosamine transporter [Ceratobasidium sp. 394]
MQSHISASYIAPRIRTDGPREGSTTARHEARTRSVKVPLPRVMPITPGLFDFAVALSLVFGGCCTNAWTLERVLNEAPSIGTTLTFAQMTFITLQALPSFIQWRKPTWSIAPLPVLKPRAVPFSVWAFQVILVSSISFLNNLTYRYKLPLSVQIILRSAGLIVSMTIGFLFSGKRYSKTQLLAALTVTIGVLTTTTAKPTASASSTPNHDATEYTLGITCLALSLLMSGLLGLFQERAFAKYGPHWKEGVFYTHALSLPIISLMWSDITHGWHSLASSTATSAFFGFSTLHAILAMNVITQVVCVSGVNSLTSKVSSVTTNLVLTARKAASLCLSVWWFGTGVSARLALGATLVFAGTVMYAQASSKPSAPTKGQKTE